MKIGQSLDGSSWAGHYAIFETLEEAKKNFFTKREEVARPDIVVEEIENKLFPNYKWQVSGSSMTVRYDNELIAYHKALTWLTPNRAR